MAAPTEAQLWPLRSSIYGELVVLGRGEAKELEMDEIRKKMNDKR
jgi:hypothetical protein